VGHFISEMLGLNQVGSLMMGSGMSFIATAAAAHFIGFGLPLGIAPLHLFIAGVILVIASLFFKLGKCPPKKVVFTCKPWQPPVGGGDCDVCNENPLKPCSEYRCKSLGAACELLNKGTGDELCVDENPNDVNFPEANPNLEISSDNLLYEDVSDDGFRITSLDGDCLEAYENLMFGITTNEPAQCKFDLEMKEFEEMSFDLGSNSYKYNHTTTFILPDPSHGVSQGSDWNGDLSFYVKCQDTHGNMIPGFYTVDMCVNQGPDNTPVRISSIAPRNEGLISFNKSER